MDEGQLPPPLATNPETFGLEGLGRQNLEQLPGMGSSDCPVPPLGGPSSSTGAMPLASAEGYASKQVAEGKQKCEQ